MGCDECSNPELNTWLAVNLMGWRKITKQVRFADFSDGKLHEVERYISPLGAEHKSLPLWSTSSGLAMDEIVPAMEADDWEREIIIRPVSNPLYRPDERVYVQFSRNGKEHCACHATVAGAICLAANVALEAEGGET